MNKVSLAKNIRAYLTGTDMYDGRRHTAQIDPRLIADEVFFFTGIGDTDVSVRIFAGVATVSLTK